MNKHEVSQRVLRNGKPLDESKFTWDETTQTFSTIESDLVIDFTGISGCTFNTGWNCRFTTGWSCMFKTGSYCTFTTGWNCTFTTGWNCMFNTDSYCTFTTGSVCTFNTDSNCTFNTGSNCTFNTDSYCTFNTGSNCTFNTDSYCTFNTGSHCTFTADSDCTFNTGWNCMFKTGSYCTFTTDEQSVIVRRDRFCVVIGERNVQLLPHQYEGHVVKRDGESFFHFPDEKDEIVVVDNIASKVISRKTIKGSEILKVVNLGETDESYVVTANGLSAHGKTVKECKESLIYKITDRDTSEFDSLTLDSEVTFEQGVKMYRVITGSCESQTREFAESHRFTGTKTIAEIIEITKGQYNHDALTGFFNR